MGVWLSNLEKKIGKKNKNKKTQRLFPLARGRVCLLHICCFTLDSYLPQGMVVLQCWRYREFDTIISSNITEGIHCSGSRLVFKLQSLHLNCCKIILTCIAIHCVIFLFYLSYLSAYTER